MAYSNVGTPVFYVDNYLYHKAIGTELKETSASSGGVKPPIIPEAYTLNPSFANNINNEADWDTSGMSFTIPLAYDVDKNDFTGNKGIGFFNNGNDRIRENNGLSLKEIRDQYIRGND